VKTDVKDRPVPHTIEEPATEMSGAGGGGPAKNTASAGRTLARWGFSARIQGAQWLIAAVVILFVSVAFSYGGIDSFVNPR